MLKCLRKTITMRIFKQNPNKMMISEIKNSRVGNSFFIPISERMEFREKLNKLKDCIWFINLKKS